LNEPEFVATVQRLVAIQVRGGRDLVITAADALEIFDWPAERRCSGAD